MYKDQQLLSTACLGKRPFAHKLDMFGKGIRTIDMVSSLNPTIIKEIDLSHNAISNIDCISQFKQVQKINFSHNKIVSWNELLKLNSFTKLKELQIKGNPFLKQAISMEVRKFLLTLQVDEPVISNERMKKFKEIQQMKKQISCFEVHLNRLKMHLQLNNQFEMQINNTIVGFPKIKKIFQQFIYPSLNIKKQILKYVQAIDLQNEKIDHIFNLLSQNIQNKKGHIIQQIYLKQQALKISKIKPNINKRKILTVKSNSQINHPLEIKQQKHNTQNKKLITKQNFIMKQKINLLTIKEEETFQTTYFIHLIKCNPVFHLLHSPLSSLKSKEKDLLIQNLSVTLKQKIKQINKFNKIIQLYQNNEANYLEEIQNTKNQFYQYQFEKNETIERLKIVSDNFERQHQKVNFLCEQLKEIKKQSEQILKQNKIKKNIQLQINNLQQNLFNQEASEQIIQKNKQIKLKIKYFKKITNKAIALFNYNFNKQRKELIYKKQLLKQVFQQFKIITHIEKQTKYLNTIKSNQIKKQLIINIKKIFFTQKYLKLLQKFLKNNNLKRFIKIVKKQQIKTKNRSVKIIENKKIKEKKIKFKVFNLLCRQVCSRKQQQQKHDIKYYQQKLMLSSFFRRWLISKNLFYVREAQINLLIKDSIRKKFLKQLTLNHFDNKQIKIKFYALNKFIQQYRRIYNFHVLTKYLSGLMWKSKSKCRMITVKQLHANFIKFNNITRAKRLKTIIKKQDQQHNKKKIKIIQIEDNKIKRRKQIILQIKFKKILYKIRIKTIFHIIHRNLKEYYLINNEKRKNIKQFLFKLLENKSKEIRIKNKLQILTIHRIKNKAYIFLNKIKLNINFQRKYLKLFEQYKNKINLKTIFYKWKIISIINLVAYYKKKFDQLRPQIDEIMLRQKQTNNEKIKLLRQMQNKQTQLCIYEKKIAQYECLLHSKEIKYEKLKDIYADAIAERDNTPDFIAAKDNTSLKAYQTKSNIFNLKRF